MAKSHGFVGRHAPRRTRLNHGPLPRHLRAHQLVVAEAESRALRDWLAAADRTVLRTLDALYIAAALTLGDELEGIVAYDERLTQAATALAIRVVAPRG